MFLDLDFTQCIGWNVVMTTSIDWSIFFLIHLVILNLVAFWTRWLDLSTLQAHLDICQSKRLNSTAHRLTHHHLLLWLISVLLLLLLLMRSEPISSSHVYSFIRVMSLSCKWILLLFLVVHVCKSLRI